VLQAREVLFRIEETLADADAAVQHLEAAARTLPESASARPRSPAPRRYSMTTPVRDGIVGTRTEVIDRA
jgi:hypothetical protein